MEGERGRDSRFCMQPSSFLARYLLVVHEQHTDQYHPLFRRDYLPPHLPRS